MSLEKKMGWIMELGEIIDSYPESKSREPETWESITGFISLHQDKEEMIKYWNQRNAYNQRISPIVSRELLVLQRSLGGKYRIDSIKLMSSYSARTNLSGISDIDIGIIVARLDESMVRLIQGFLESQDYQFIKKMAGYYCYNKTIDQIEIEVKVRDLDKSLHVIQLHDYLDNVCEEKEKIIFTYLKYQAHGVKDIYPKLYSFVKILFYNLGLIKINPDAKWFFTNV